MSWRPRLTTKPYLAEWITSEQLGELADLLKEVGEIIPRIQRSIPAVTRAPKDDCLLACALIGQADYLVSGDADLLVLEHVDRLSLLSPRDFVQLLSAARS
jgi:uncharacterized protein